jgi:hypothetical protein
MVGGAELFLAAVLICIAALRIWFVQYVEQPRGKK